MFDALVIPLTVGTLMGGVLTILWMMESDLLFRNPREILEFIIAPQMFIYFESRNRFKRSVIITLEVITTLLCIGANIITIGALIVFGIISLIYKLFERKVKHYE